MNTWRAIFRFFRTPLGIAIVITLVVIFVPGLTETLLRRIDTVLEVAHGHFQAWANRHLADAITGFLLIIGGLWAWRRVRGNGDRR